MSLTPICILVSLLLFACGNNEREGSTTQRGADWRRVVATLCAAAAQAKTDRQPASDLFFDDAHDPLHVVADSAARRDRATAARLLEAKNLVESSFETESRSLPNDLEELARRVDVALEALNVRPVGCA
jgi:hypothetical protein